MNVQDTLHLRPITFGQFFGLSFERPYLMQGLKLNHVKSAKTADFEIHCFWNLLIFKIHWFLKSADFQNPEFLGKTKDHLPRKVTPIFCFFTLRGVVLVSEWLFQKSWRWYFVQWHDLSIGALSNLFLDNVSFPSALICHIYSWLSSSLKQIWRI